MTLFKNIFSDLRDTFSARHEPENVKIIVEALWRVMLLVAAVGCIAVLFVGMWHFVRVLDLLNASDSNQVTRATGGLNRTLMRSVLEGSARREATSAGIQSNVQFVEDPSKVR